MPTEHPWIIVKPTGTRTSAAVHRDPILPGMTDGWPHRRARGGYCITCGANEGEYHGAMTPRRAPDAPIYDALVADRIEEHEVRHKMLMQGYGPLTIEAGVRFWRRHRERMTQ